MFKCAAVLIGLALAGCTASPENKTEVTIKNHTTELLAVQVGSGILGTVVYLPPGGGWSGWIDKRWIGSTAVVEIRSVVPRPPVR